ncbi:MAG: RIP metalloprotease RseP [Syntrophus sp. (in: bacteria)]|nr:RIP metalloprotease RseP [Syntrophus sp. (in: bacteria)]MBA4418411.1 RIP metalloprotease RseP [Syntrophus sp. (in: bacteria)]
MINIIYGIVALSLLILVHELGHFLVARLANVKVLAFSLGFGKKLISFTKGETEYALSLVPLGGYVKLLGESIDDEISEEDIPRSYAHKPAWVKIAIAFTGPLFNIIFAFLLFYIVFLSGYSVLSTKVGSVEKDLPAYAAGIQKGDILMSVDGKPLQEFSDLMDYMGRASGGPHKFVVKRGDQLLDISITPKEMESKNIFGETVKRKVIGVAASDELVTRNETLAGAASRAAYQTYYLSKVTIVGIVKLIQGSISTKNIGGPILILQAAGKQAKEGKKNLIFFVAIISINLGVVNLLPIPILDGGHILFHLIELVTRRRLSAKTIDIAQKVGMAILIFIMVFATYNDLNRLFDFTRFFGGK